MPKGSLAAGVRLVARVSILSIATSPLWAQGTGSNFFPTLPQISPAASHQISVDILRNPLPDKVLAKLEKAMKPAQMGNHQQAIEDLKGLLREHPKAAPYIYNLLGIEYEAVHQVAPAVASFEETLRVMPHLSANHYNLGVSLLDAGDVDRAEQELHTAVDLDPANVKAKRVLAALRAALRQATH